MGFWALLLSAGLYAIVSVDLFIKKRHALGIVFLCYAVANIAYIYIAYGDDKPKS
jgi:hypothetical protein